MRYPADVGERAAGRKCVARRARRSADLFARLQAQTLPQRGAPLADAGAVAAEPLKVAVTLRHVRDRIERRYAGEQRRVAREQEQALLSAHARSEGVDV